MFGKFDDSGNTVVLMDARLMSSLFRNELFRNELFSGSETYNDNITHYKTIDNEQKEDYSSYLSSLDSYCRKWGYIMPEVKGLDYHSAYAAWSNVYSQWSSDHNYARAAEENDPYYDFWPVQFSDGSVIFTDLAGHGEVDVVMLPNGLPHVSGRRSAVTALGGRGEFDTLIRHIADRNYFNDGKTE